MWQKRVVLIGPGTAEQGWPIPISLKMFYQHNAIVGFPQPIDDLLAASAKNSEHQLAIVVFLAVTILLAYAEDFVGDSVGEQLKLKRIKIWVKWNQQNYGSGNQIIRILYI